MRSAGWGSRCKLSSGGEVVVVVADVRAVGDGLRYITVRTCARKQVGE